MKIALLLAIMSYAFASNSEQIITLNEPLGDVSMVKVNINFGFGSLLVETGSAKQAVTGYVRYHPKFTEATMEYNEYGTTGVLDIETDFDFDWEFGDDTNDSGNEGEVYITNAVPVKMYVDSGLGEVALNLGGIQLEDLVVDSGLGEAYIDFGNTLNPIKCRRIDVDTGLGSTEIKNLLYSNSPEMEFECGLGSMELDFSGILAYDIKIDLAVGMGSITAWVPEDVNVIVEYDGNFLSSIELDDFTEVSDEEYRSTGFSEGQPTMFFSASVGAGSLEIIKI